MSHLPPLTVFDIETTGLDPRRGHRIVEIAGVRLEGGILHENASFSSFVNPERDIPWEAKQVNKIADEDVAYAPAIEIVLPQFLSFAKGSLLVAHNAAFDYGFLEAEKEFCWGYVELPECFCTLSLSQVLYPKDFRHNLDALSHKFGLTPPSARHRALADAILTGRSLQRMIADADITTLEDFRRRASIRQTAGKR